MVLFDKKISFIPISDDGAIPQSVTLRLTRVSPRISNYGKDLIEVDEDKIRFSGRRKKNLDPEMYSDFIMIHNVAPHTTHQQANHQNRASYMTPPVILLYKLERKFYTASFLTTDSRRVLTTPLDLSCLLGIFCGALISKGDGAI